MIIGKNTLILLVVAIVVVGVVNGVSAFFRDVIGINIGMGTACCVSIFLAIAVLVPWVMFSQKYKELKDTKELHKPHPNTYCSQCGKLMSDTKFGKFCESCQRYA